LKNANKTFGLKDVKTWIENTGSMEARLNWYGTFAANSELYLKVAKPLLSMRTVGSMDVERTVKPVKHEIMTRNRNRLSDPKGVALFRAKVNLKHIMGAKQRLGKRITDSF